MKKFAVGYISFFDNNLSIEIIESLDWASALMQHSKFAGDDFFLPIGSLEEAKIEAFNCDMMVDVKEIV